jgi:muconate cycloisomerase
MPDSLLVDTSHLARDLAIQSVQSTIVDVPTVRKHKLSQTSVTEQNYVLVQVRLANGAEGIGEAATLGGPRWSEESVEAMKANIDAYLAPAVLGARADHFETAGLRMHQAAKRNNAAKAAIETALFDAVGKTFGLPASALLGGAVRDRIPTLDTCLGRPGPGNRGSRAQARSPAALHVQGEDRRPGARSGHGAHAPPRRRA